jgi:hypothetical protein
MPLSSRTRAPTPRICEANLARHTSPPLIRYSSSILNDAKFAFTGLNATLFPGVSDDVQVHDGFAYAQGRTADDVLAAVQGALADKKASKVLVHGHSLGAAIAMMDSLMLRLQLDASVPVSTTVFGLPRGGNQAYADLLDKQVRPAFSNANDHTLTPHAAREQLSVRHEPARPGSERAAALHRLRALVRRGARERGRRHHRRADRYRRVRGSG